MTVLAIVMSALAGAFALLAVLAAVSWRYYKLLTKREAKDFKTYNEYAQPDGILFLGDSLTDFFPIGEYFSSEKRLYNRGIAGNTTFDVLGRIEDAVALSPSEVFLQIGINDLIYLSGKKAQPAALVQRIMEIASHFSGARMHILSLYPVNRKKTLFARTVCFKANNRKVREVNAILRDAAEAGGYGFIDLFEALCDGDGNLAREFTVEGLHLSAKGYCVVADVLQKYIEE